MQTGQGVVSSHLGLDAPSPWVSRFAHLVPSGRVLDLACGGGRHSRLFVSRGHQVWAVDRDEAALAAVSSDARIQAIRVDLEMEQGAEQQACWPFAGHRYAGIVVTNYLHRPLLPLILASLAEGGVLIYETFALGNAEFGKPSNPAFLLQPGELLQAVRDAGPGLHVLAYEDGVVDLPKPARVQRICVLRSESTELVSAKLKLTAPAAA